jgi:hypothetical protein
MKKDVMCWICGTHEKEEKCMQELAEKAEGKRQLGRLRRKWEDNIKMDL